MIRLLHAADLHLDAPFPSLGSGEQERRADFIQTFERIVTLAIKSEVDLLLVAGDLFDRPRPSSAVVGKVQAAFRRLVDRGIVPVVLPGTHDSVVPGDSVYRTAEFPGAVMLTNPRVEEPVCVQVREKSVFLYGFAYRGFDSDEAFAGMSRRAAEGVHIGLLHGSRQGSPEWDYRKKDLPFTLDHLRAWNLDYVALGHYHSFELFQAAGRLYGCYPGSPEGKRFGENGPRHCVLVTIDADGTRVEKAVVNTKVLDDRELDLSGCADQAEAAEAICALGSPDLLLKLRLTGIVEAPLDLEALQGRCSGNFFHLELRDATHLFDSDLARRIEGEQTVRGIFVRNARKAIAEADPDAREHLEGAFREVLVRFRAFGEVSQ